MFAKVALKTRSERSPRGSWSVSGAAWDAFGRLLATLGPPGASPDRAWGASWTSTSRPERVRPRPGNDFGPPNQPNIDFSSIFPGFWLRFIDFQAIFRRFSFEPPATKQQNQNLKKESRDPHHTSWLLRCALASYCSHVFRNDFRTLHVRPFFVAHPQAHLSV